MALHRKKLLSNWLKGWFRSRAAQSPEIRQAREVIAAVDAGGVPLNPLKINEIARNLGLEVSRKAPVEETIRRIRDALGRQSA